MDSSQTQKSKPLLSSTVGNRWSLIAAQLPGRTDNDVKNHWNTKLKKKLSGTGIDPVTHKPFSHLMAEIATTLAPPNVANLAEAALGCFKDEMLHLLTKKPMDFQFQHSNVTTVNHNTGNYSNNKHGEKEQDMLHSRKSWNDLTGATSANVAGNSNAFPFHSMSGFQYRLSMFGKEGGGGGSPWSQSLCTGSTACTGVEQQGHYLHDKLDEDIEEESEGGKEMRDGSNMFNSDSVMWDLPSDDNESKSDTEYKYKF